MGLLDERGFLLGLLLVHALCHKVLHLLAVMLVKGHVIVANQMVTLLAAALWCLAVAILEPCQHAFADVDAAVVHDIGFHHLVTVGLHHIGQCPSQQVVTHMAQVEGLVGVGAAVFNHHQGAFVRHRHKAVVGVLLDMLQQLHPCLRIDGEVEESLHYVVFHHLFRCVGYQIFAQVACCVLGLFPACLQKREDHQGELPLKFRPCFLELYLVQRKLGCVQCVDAVLYGFGYFGCNFHTLY